MKSLVEFINEAKENKIVSTDLSGDQFNKLTNLLVPILKISNKHQSGDQSTKLVDYFAKLHDYCKDNLTPIDFKTTKSLANHHIILDVNDKEEVYIAWVSGSWSDGYWNYIFLEKRGDKYYIEDNVNANQKWAHKPQAFVSNLNDLKDKSKYLVYNFTGKDKNDNPFLAAVDKSK